MKTTQTTFLRMIVGIWLLLGPTASEAAPIVGPLLQTTWGQDGVWQQSTPLKDGNPTFPGCTTIATAQILYFYQYLDRQQFAPVFFRCQFQTGTIKLPH